MNIPPSLHRLFETPVSLPDKDVERLTPYLSGWPKLNKLLMRGVNAEDLKRLILMELLGERRASILERLIMRLGRVQRKELAERVGRFLR